MDLSVNMDQVTKGRRGALARTLDIKESQNGCRAEGLVTFVAELVKLTMVEKLPEQVRLTVLDEVWI